MVLVRLRGSVQSTHVALAYLLLVQVASARGGRALGVVLAVAAFLSFDFFLLQPFGTLRLNNPHDWFVLAAFLLASLISSHLLIRLRAAAEEARRFGEEAAEARALKAADRAKDAVLASVSHDLRTPLTSISALAQELAETGDERAMAIAEDSDRLNRFVADMLDQSRLQSGAIVLGLEPNEAEDLIGAAAQRVRGQLGDRELRISVTPSGEMLFGRFDFVHTLRAIVNLIENALRFSPPGGAVDLEVHREGHELVITVGDRGPGISDAERERVFEAFYRGQDNGTSSMGLGLGLSIARGLIAAQGGQLLYRSRDGGGANFEIRLPAVDVTALAD
jgi:two-component system sensor histidine kinase KdpD